jgi:hypothetical protein
MILIAYYLGLRPAGALRWDMVVLALGWLKKALKVRAFDFDDVQSSGVGQSIFDHRQHVVDESAQNLDPTPPTIF